MVGEEKVGVYLRAFLTAKFAKNAKKVKARKDMVKTKEDELSFVIIGAAIDVHREPGTGLLESANVIQIKDGGISRVVLNL